MSTLMSKHSYSVLTSDLRRNPAILADLQHEVAAATGYVQPVRVIEHGPVTTVTAVAA